jgi:prepilin-type N-terminal cleavage/methylation domain-containing protein
VADRPGEGSFPLRRNAPQTSPRKGEGKTRPAGFTLIELLLVCALLSAVAMLTFGAYANVDRHAENELAKTQTLTLAAALRRFHDDTGYWPGEGPFRLAGGGKDCADLSVGGLNPELSHMGIKSIKNETDRTAWFSSPANMSLLYTAPVFCEGHPLAALEKWNADAGRGWRGPYLPRVHQRWLDIGEEDRDAFTDGVLRKDVPAFGAGPAFPAAGERLVWRALPPGEDEDEDERRPVFREHARPLLFFLDPPRVAYWGPDGQYDGAEDDDAPCVGQGDDWVVCL